MAEKPKRTLAMVASNGFAMAALAAAAVALPTEGQPQVREIDPEPSFLKQTPWSQKTKTDYARMSAAERKRQRKMEKNRGR